MSLAAYCKQYAAAVVQQYNFLGTEEAASRLSLLKDRNPLLSAKMVDHARRQAEGLRKKWEDDQKKLAEEIAGLEEELEAPTKKPKKGVRKLTARDIRKIQRKLASRKKRVGKHPCFGGRTRLLAYNALRNKKDPKASEALEEYRSHRDIGYRSEGECARAGNRNFDFGKMLDGILIFTPERGERVQLDLLVGAPRLRSKQHRQLLKACSMACEGKLAVTVTVTVTEVFFTYDNAAVEGFAFDAAGFNAAKKKAYDVPSYKEVAKTFYREQEARMSIGKVPNRVMAVDLNPERIGYVVLDLDVAAGAPTVVASGCFEYKGLTKKYKDLYKREDPKHHTRASNERNYWLSVIVARLGRLALHHKCEQFAMEGLDIKRPVYNRRTKRFNRVVNALWCRGLIERGVKKFCGNGGILLKEIPPEYSSMVGNLLFRAFDPVSAAAEIGRRAMSWQWTNKFGKESLPESLQWYPSLERLSLGNDMSYVPAGTRTVGALYRCLCASETSVRRQLSDDQIAVHATFNKARVSHYSLSTALFDFR